MIGRTFFRWSSASVFIGSVILTIGYLLRANIDKQYIDEFASTQGFVSSLMVGTGSLLFLFGLPALFAAQNFYSTKSGILASLFAFTGMAAFHLGTLALYFVLPVLVNHSAATRALIYSDAPPFPRFAIFWATGLLVLIIGLLWIGIKAWRNSNHWKLSSFLFIASALVFLAAPIVYFPLVKPANTLVMLGFALDSTNVFRQRTKTISSPADLEIVEQL